MCSRIKQSSDYDERSPCGDFYEESLLEIQLDRVVVSNIRPCIEDWMEYISASNEDTFGPVEIDEWYAKSVDPFICISVVDDERYDGEIWGRQEYSKDLGPCRPGADDIGAAEVEASCT